MKRPPRVQRPEETRFVRSFHFAFAGVLHATRTQRNMRIHLAIGAAALLATAILRLGRAYVALIVVLVALVNAFELVNTAIEAVVDLLEPKFHERARVAKDAAAGAVLFMAVAAVIVGYLVFYEGIVAAGTRVYLAAGALPFNVVLIALALVGMLTIALKAAAGYGSPLQGGAVSGHASLAFAGATIIALLTQTPTVALLAYFLAFLVAQSRVEAGIHNIAEVVLGAALGTTVAYALFRILRGGH